VERCVDRIEEMKALGITAMLDPCPSDLGRDVELMAEVAQRTRFTLICATGLYKEARGRDRLLEVPDEFRLGASTRWPSCSCRELTEGVAGTGIRAGIIKVGTGHGTLTAYEQAVFRGRGEGLARDRSADHDPHRRGPLRRRSAGVPGGNGVPAHRIVIGHSCGRATPPITPRSRAAGPTSASTAFGLDMIQPDTERVASLARLIAGGFGRQIVVSHDSVWCWNGQPAPREALEQMEKIWNPTHFVARGSRRACATRASAMRRSTRSCSTTRAASSRAKRSDLRGAQLRDPRARRAHRRRGRSAAES
jgi:phosphotriesterase-related protein